MFTYVGLIELTPEGRETLDKAPEYLEKFRHIIEEEGGTLEDTFAVMGPWDFLAIVKYPDNAAAFRALAQIGKLEVVKTETFPVEKVDVFRRLKGRRRAGSAAPRCAVSPWHDRAPDARSASRRRARNAEACGEMAHERTSGLYLMRCGSSASGAARLAHPVGVLAPVALEPRHLAVALEGEDVRRDAVEEPAVVGDDDGAAGEVEQRVLERAQRVDVEVVGRLVEQQDVAAAAQQLREVDAVALAARELADRLLLVAAAEVEPRDVLARVDLALAEQDRCPGRRRSPSTPCSSGRGRRATGRRSASCTVSPIRSAPASGVSSPAIIRKSVVLPAPFGPITPTMPAGGSENVRFSMRSRSPKPFVTPFGLDHEVAEARARRDVDLDLVELHRVCSSASSFS